MSRHDRPLGGTQVQEVREQVARQQLVAPASPGVERAGVAHQASPSAVAARRSPVSVRSGCTEAISRVSGTISGARPPVAIACGGEGGGGGPLPRPPGGEGGPQPTPPAAATPSNPGRDAALGPPPDHRPGGESLRARSL